MLEEHSKNIRRERKKMQWGTYVSEGCLQFFHGWNTDKKKRQRLTTTTDKKKNVEEVRRDRDHGAGKSKYHQLSQIQPQRAAGKVRGVTTPDRTSAVRAGSLYRNWDSQARHVQPAPPPRRLGRRLPKQPRPRTAHRTPKHAHMGARNITSSVQKKVLHRGFRRAMK